MPHRYNEKRIKISLGALSQIEYSEGLGLTTQTSLGIPPRDARSILARR